MHSSRLFCLKQIVRELEASGIILNGILSLVEAQRPCRVTLSMHLYMTSSQRVFGFSDTPQCDLEGYRFGILCELKLALDILVIIFNSGFFLLVPINCTFS